MAIFEGSGVAIVTPFKSDGSIDYIEFENLINFHIENNTNAIIVCGTTGESATLSDNEKLELINCAIKCSDKKIPIIAGTGSNCTEHSVYLSKEAEKLGADACLIVTPYYNKTSQNGLISHYKHIAYNIDIPIILYNVPSRTGVNIEPDTCLELSKVDNIVAIKEASSNISQILEIASLCRDKIDLYAGNDDQISTFMALGAQGVISVVANIIPNHIYQICRDYFDGNLERSVSLQLELISLIKVMFCEANPIPIKFALSKMGFKSQYLRLPLVELSLNNQKYVEQELMKLKIKSFL